LRQLQQLQSHLTRQQLRGIHNRSMKSIRNLATPPAHLVGRVERIVVRGRPRERAREVQSTMALAAVGLADDRLARMFHQSLLYGPGGASDRAIWAFLMV
jgi:hypothetical protein